MHTNLKASHSRSEISSKLRGPREVFAMKEDILMVYSRSEMLIYPAAVSSAAIIYAAQLTQNLSLQP